MWTCQLRDFRVSPRVTAVLLNMVKVHEWGVRDYRHPRRSDRRLSGRVGHTGRPWRLDVVHVGAEARYISVIRLLSRGWRRWRRKLFRSFPGQRLARHAA